MRNPDSRYSRLRPLLVTAFILAVLVPAGPAGATGGTAFVDVATSPHREGIERISAEGITSGCSTDRFCPGVAVTRAQMATFLGRALELSPVEGERFVDVVATSVHAGAVNAVTDAEIARGYSDGTFRPHAPVTRGQMAAFLQRSLSLPDGRPGVFDDLVGAPFELAASAIVDAGLTSGCASRLYCGHEVVTRGQMATFLSRLLDVRAGVDLTPAPASRPGVGANLHAGWGGQTDAERTAVLDLLAAAGIEWVRVDVGWITFEEAGDDQYAAWYEQRIGSVVDQARARGIKVLLMAHQTPAWANGGAGKAAPPDDPAEYGEFMEWLAGRFAGRVAAYQVWNEPNVSKFWTGTVAEYTALLRAGFAGVRAGDPAAQVVLAGPASNDDAWFRELYAAGAKGYFDVAATQPYMDPSDLPPETTTHPLGDRYAYGLMDHVGEIRRLMLANGDDKPIWFTEFGWSAHANTGDEVNWERGVTEAQQADYWVRALEFVAANHPYVENTFWYNARDKVSGDAHQDGFGFLRRDLTPKPAYDRIRAYLGR